jgi:hypothetical protein
MNEQSFKIILKYFFVMEDFRTALFLLAMDFAFRIICMNTFGLNLICQKRFNLIQICFKRFKIKDYQ